MSYTLIERKELTEAASSISFDNIPQFYSDLLVKFSARTNVNEVIDTCLIDFNGLSTGFTNRSLYGDPGGASSAQFNEARRAGHATGNTQTANTFATVELYIPNYAGATSKSVSVESATEGTSAYFEIMIGSTLWSNTAAINSLTLRPFGSSSFVPSSTFSLYGINRQQAIGAPKAVGGVISFANGYWVHTFTGSGTFSSQQDLDVDALVVAGGGGGFQGGGGAGGLRYVANTLRLPLGAYTVLVGAGGSQTSSGTNSGFSTITSIGGGGGGRFDNLTTARTGGSGGGGGGSDSTGFSGAAGTSGQGNAGGNGFAQSGVGPAGGGGGAGANGSNAASSAAGNGGAGTILSITGSSTALAGGGGGGIYNSGTAGTGGSGGGGNGGSGASPGTNAVAGVANTGGGGGGAGFGIPGAGGSGVVIIRYKA